MIRRYWFPLLLVALLPFLIAARFFQVVPAAVEQVIFWIVALLAGWLGPHPLEVLFTVLNVDGVVAVILTYVIAAVIAAIAVYAAKTFLGYEPPGDIWLLAFLILGASQLAFNRLKDNPQTAAKFS